MWAAVGLLGARGVRGLPGVLPLVPDMYSFHTFPSQAAIASDQVKRYIIPGHKLMKIWRDVPEMYENQPLISPTVGEVTPRRWVAPMGDAASGHPATPSGRLAAGWAPRIADLQPCAPYYHFSTKLCAL